MVQAARQCPKPPQFLSSFNRQQRSPMREDSPNNKLQQLPNITVTVCTKAVKKEALSPRPLSLGSPPPSGKASRSYSSDASDEDQHKAKKFKRAEVKEPHLIG
jgi:hypothetical protein